MSQLLTELKTKKEQVLYLLEKYPAARDNDFYLEYLWLREFLPNGKKHFPFLDWNVIKEVGGQLGSIERVRQKIQNEDKLFLPSPEVQAERRGRAERFRKAIGEV